MANSIRLTNIEKRNKFLFIIKKSKFDRINCLFDIASSSINGRKIDEVIFSFHAAFIP